MSGDQCKVCGNDQTNKTVVAKEMMLGYGDRFDYLECSSCGCLQIKELPKDIGRYYPENYYSYERRNEDHLIATSAFCSLVRAFRKARLDRYLKGNSLLGTVISSAYWRHYPWIRANSITRKSKILDVGCGSGGLLLKMYKDGFEELSGVDPFIKEDIQYRCGVHVHKKEIHELTDNYDLVMLHHSFEHMAEPLTILKNIRRILKDDGQVVLRVPLADSYAWRKYGVSWVQFDAPRHFFLHTVRSIQILCDQAGFKLDHVEYDSGAFQFTGSERYLRDIPMAKESGVCSKKQRRAFKAEAKRLNAIRDGDSACFYLNNKP